MKTEKLPAELIKQYKEIYLVSSDNNMDILQLNAAFHSDLHKANTLYDLLKKLNLHKGLPVPPSVEYDEDDDWYDWKGSRGFDSDYKKKMTKKEKANRPFSIIDLDETKDNSTVILNIVVVKTFSKTITSGTHALQDLWYIEVKDDSGLAFVAVLPEDVPFEGGKNTIEHLKENQKLILECRLNKTKKQENVLVLKKMTLVND